MSVGIDLTEALKTDLAMFKTSSGDLGRVSGLANLKRALFRRLITVPGTLVYHPTYGIGIGMYQNAPSSFALQQKLSSIIKEQFSQDTRIQAVDSVAFNSSDESPQLTRISVSLTPVGYTEQTMLFTPFDEGNS